MDTGASSKESVEFLHEPKSSKNISATKDSDHKTSIDVKQKTMSYVKRSVSADIETVFETVIDVGSDKSDSTTDCTVENENAPKGSRAGSLERKSADSKENHSIPSKEKSIHELNNKKTPSQEKSVVELDVKKTPIKTDYSISSSPSGKLNRRRDMSSSIFPAGTMGCKEEPPADHNSPRRFLGAQEVADDHAGHLDNTPRKRPSSAKLDVRNPLTGAGMDATATTRYSYRRKDGNPLLGVGYEDSDPTPTVSTSRVPPGGFSKGLW